MKKPVLILLTGMLTVLSLTLTSWKDLQKGPGIPEDIESVLSTSCYACHSTGSKSADAVKAINFKKWDDYKASKKVARLNGIKEVLKEGTMPPGKFLKKYPDKAVSESNMKKVIEWTEKETARLME